MDRSLLHLAVAQAFRACVARQNAGSQRLKRLRPVLAKLTRTLRSLRDKLAKETFLACKKSERRNTERTEAGARKSQRKGSGKCRQQLRRHLRLSWHRLQPVFFSFSLECGGLPPLVGPAKRAALHRRRQKYQRRFSGGSRYDRCWQEQGGVCRRPRRPGRGGGRLAGRGLSAAGDGDRRDNHAQ